MVSTCRRARRGIIALMTVCYNFGGWVLDELASALAARRRNGARMLTIKQLCSVHTATESNLQALHLALLWQYTRTQTDCSPARLRVSVPCNSSPMP